MVAVATYRGQMPDPDPRVTWRATGPGRVNLIGDHTDYNRGLALPMAIDLGVTVGFSPATGAATNGHLRVTSSAFPDAVHLPGRPPPDQTALSALEPAWARLVAAVVALSPPTPGGTVEITTTLPVGAGLSSSAALSVALAEVLVEASGRAPAERFTPRAIADLCQRAEHLVGVPVGAMDPLVCAGAVAGHALLIDFSTLDTTPVPVPTTVDVVVVDSGQRRTVGSSEYAIRVAECGAAAAVIGPLGLALPSDLAALDDPLLYRRARHVVSECGRVRDMVVALRDGDLVGAGRLLSASHASLAGDFEVTTPLLDQLVERLLSVPGVLWARMTGAGFGGCVVALCRPGALVPGRLDRPAWRFEPADGTVARRLTGRAGASRRDTGRGVGADG
jgi:galactokinase